MNERVRTGLRLAGLGVIVALLVIVWRTGAARDLSWSTLVAHRAALAGAVAAHPFSAPVAYAAIYAVTVAISLPVGLWLSLLAGLLFGWGLGTAVTVIGSSAGAVVLFLLARGLLAPFFEQRLAARIAKLRQGLERDGFSYLLALRLMPVFPFWLVNLAPALLGMRLAPFAAATILGVIPTSLVLNAIGAGLRATLAAGARPSARMLMAPNILVPLAGMALLALAPVLWRQVQGKGYFFEKK